MNKFIKEVVTTAKQEMPTLCCYFGVIGFVKTAYDIYKQSPAIHQDIAKYKVEKKKEKINPIDWFKATWKRSVPLIIEGTASIALCLTGNHMHNVRNAALTAAYSVSSLTLAETQKAIAALPEEQFKQVQQQVAEAVKSPQEDNKSTNSGIIVGNGKCLCQDSETGIFFESSWNEIQRIVNRITANALGEIEPIISLGDVLYELGVDKVPEYSNRIGWKIYNGKDHYLEIYPGSDITEDGRPYIVIRYVNGPEALY